jgi:alpha-galactosidase
MKDKTIIVRRKHFVIHSLFHSPLIVLVLLVGAIYVHGAQTNFISSLDISQVEQALGEPQADRSVGGHQMSIGGISLTNGLGTRAPSRFIISVGGCAQSFSAVVGVDDEVGNGKGGVAFKVVADGRTLWEGKKVRAGDPAEAVNVSLAGVKQLTLLVEGGKSDFNHADWANASVVMTNGLPYALTIRKEEAVILTPKSSLLPRINGPKIFGVRPGAPFLYTIAATGDRPMTFTAEGLPSGLQLDPQTGRVTGSLKEKGGYNVTFGAKNKHGAATRGFRIICGAQVGLTPALGWNTWNGLGETLSADKVKAAADAMVASGLINHGWTYINIDTCWQMNPNRPNDPTRQGPPRDPAGYINPNLRFPDMKGLVDYIHSLGLKAGIYSSPGPWDCLGSVGSLDYELLDAHQYEKWGFDYLKYDWCSYAPIVEERRNLSKPFVSMLTNWISSFPESNRDYMRPFAIMRTALNKVNRDIVFSICQYGMSNVWQWGADVGGNSWRTTGDIVDLWAGVQFDYQKSVSGIGFSQNSLGQYAGPGHFNDPDMLVVGKVGGWESNLHPTRLTPNEQYTHISLWCLLSSPLLIGCDMTQLDPFTLGLLSNDEVLDVDQDPLGRQASCVSKEGPLEVWAKDMQDGSKAVGLFNRGYGAATVTAKWSNLGLTGKQKVRDLWRQKDLGTSNGEFTAKVPRHGVVLVKISK